MEPVSARQMTEPRTSNGGRRGPVPGALGGLHVSVGLPTRGHDAALLPDTLARMRIISVYPQAAPYSAPQSGGRSHERSIDRIRIAQRSA